MDNTTNNTTNKTESKSEQNWQYNPLFELGRVVATPAALAIGLGDIIELLIKHADLEQGELGDEDQQSNVNAVKDGDRIVSKFKLAGDITSFYVITEGDRSYTTVMLPGEY